MRARQVAVSVLATALFVGVPVSASAEMTSAAAGCPTSYKGPGTILTSHFGKNDPNYNNGVTSFYGRKFYLRTGQGGPDRSAGHIYSGRQSGDRIWLDVTRDKGRTWVGCGSLIGSHTRWFAHYDDSANTLIRVCIRVDTRDGRKTKCQAVGNYTDANGRRWWKDTP